MKRFGFLLATATLSLTASLTAAQNQPTQTATQPTAQPTLAEPQTYELRLLLNGQPLAWDVGEGVNRNGAFFQVTDTSAPLVVYFTGGTLELELADYGTFERAHVVGMRSQRVSETPSMGATVRHHGGGDPIVIRFDGENVSSGVLRLEEASTQLNTPNTPFTRSQAGVHASGEVRVSADDGVHGSGSVIVVDLDSEPFSSLKRINLRYELVAQ